MESKLAHQFPHPEAATAMFSPKMIAKVPRWLARLGIPEHDRDDVAGEVWLCVCRSWPTFDPLRATPERWVNRIAFHVCSHYHERACRRREVLFDEPPQISDPSPDALSLIVAEESRISVLDALNRLEMSDRSVLVEHDIDGIPMDSVAQSREMPVGACYRRRARVLAALRAKIEPLNAARL